MHDAAVLAADNARVLGMGLTLLRRIGDGAYGPDEQASRGGVGPQFRHLIDFYRCFLRGIERGRIDYGCRDRDAGLERERGAAIRALESLIAELGQLAQRHEDSDLLVRAERPADAERSVWTRSSASRELQFLQSHTIHHYALIRGELERSGVEPAEEFGVAPSTLEHWRGATLAAD